MNGRGDSALDFGLLSQSILYREVLTAYQGLGKNVHSHSVHGFGFMRFRGFSST